MNLHIRAVHTFSALVALFLLPIGVARASVIDLAPNGFEVSESVAISAPPEQIYAAIASPSHWWSSRHTYSGDAANLSLEPKAGGCWCETVPDGSTVLHMTVLYAAPGKELRLSGALGPFQSLAVAGVLDWTIAKTATGADVIADYRIGGYAKGGFSELAPAADTTLGEQVARLKNFVETGSPEAAH